MYEFVLNHSYLIPLLPLAGAAFVGLFGARLLRGQSHWAIWLTVGASAVLSLILLWGMFGQHLQKSHLEDAGQAAGTPYIGFINNWYTWVAAGDPQAAGTNRYFQAAAGAYLDPLSVVMLCVVTVVGFFITVFSKGYMAGEEGYFRFFAYLGLFIFSMTVLVMGNNFLMLYLGWEGVGLCSYLLIGYYYHRPAAREAAKKAFLVNRVGDFGFSIGIMLIFWAFGTVSYFGQGGTQGVLQMAISPNSTQAMAMTYIPFLLMIGAFGKSAQFPLYVWLPDAMEGPTPVSALIHAATMVTAGVYMIVRCGTLFVTNNTAMLTVAAVGTFTALFAAVIALRQFDLKKVFAYSTISQLGYMFAAVGVLAPAAAIFHLVTHAFFKALLFLASGAVMHAMAGELDMRKMSGLKRVLPWTNRFMLIGCLALAGFPLFSGFFSKDEIVAASFSRSRPIYAFLLITAFLTAYYTFRLYFRVFQGPEVIPSAPPTEHGVHAPDHGAASEAAIEAGDAEESGVDEQLTHQPPEHTHPHGFHSHEPLSMMLPLAILAIGALLAGYINFPERTASLSAFLGRSPSLFASYHQAGLHYGATEQYELAPARFGQPELASDGRPIHPPLVTQEMSVMMGISALVAIGGILLAYQLHWKNRAQAEELAARFPRLARMLEAKFWVDEVYQNGIVEPLRWTGRMFFNVDRYVVDGVVWAAGFVPQASALVLKLTTQRGSLQGYALTMLLGVVIILLVVFL